MSTTSRFVTYLATSGGIVTEEVDSPLFGFGTIAARPASGTTAGDLYVVIDGGLGAYRFEVWDGSTWQDMSGTAGSGITATQHKTLLQLIHFIDEGPTEGFTTGATKTVTGGLFPTLIEWKRSDATLLVEKTITRSGGGATNLAPTPIVWKMYDTDGSTLLATVSDAVTYSGINEASRVRTIS